ncbi:MAG: gamma-glutamyl-gamma-aminobutyrate hydrolase family protein, partial [Bacillota bacterium]|nr:gamma-glutamyl-gamma-aminobutyrate hydrolase family protein [Bacillota bacterium]
MAKRPVIAVAFHENISDFYGDALEQSGANLVYIQPGSDAVIPRWVNGVLLTGGGDPMASLFGEAKIAESAIPDVRRDLFEIELIRNCVAAKLPIFGICRGMQMIN